jgi:hypothetical protein
VVTRHGAGPAPTLADDLDRFPPARHLTRRRRKYFIGVLDPCASAEFTRGCPWDCSFCSAWTFYGRSYRKTSPEAAAEDLARVEEPNVFLVDDVAFVQPEHGYAIGRELERRGIRKEYYLETRCDVLVKNREVFAYWKRLGLHYMFLMRALAGFLSVFLLGLVSGVSFSHLLQRGPKKTLPPLQFLAVWRWPSSRNASPRCPFSRPSPSLASWSW